MLLVASETGHVYTFATRKLQPMITSETGKALIQVGFGPKLWTGFLFVVASRLAGVASKAFTVKVWPVGWPGIFLGGPPGGGRRVRRFGETVSAEVGIFHVCKSTS